MIWKIIKKALLEPELIELHNREVNDMLGDVPVWIVRTGSYTIYCVVILLFAGTAFFKYPDTISGTIIINDLENVDWIIANTAGTIDRFLVMDKSEVNKNDTIGIIRNAAILEDVIAFCDVLERVEYYYRTENVSLLRNYPFNLIMGEMKESYKKLLWLSEKYSIMKR